MDLILLATFVVMASGITPLPRNPTVYLQVPAPSKPTKPTVSDTKITSQTQNVQTTTIDNTETLADAPGVNGTLGEASASKFAAAKIENGTKLGDSKVDNAAGLDVTIATNKIDAEVTVSNAVDKIKRGASGLAFKANMKENKVITSKATLDVAIKTENTPEPKTTSGFLVKPGETISGITTSVRTLDSKIISDSVSPTVAPESVQNNVENGASVKYAGVSQPGNANIKSTTLEAVKKPKPPVSDFNERTDVKNRKNVPTRAELEKLGTLDPSEIDMMQYRVDIGPPPEFVTPATNSETTSNKDTTISSVTKANSNADTQIDAALAAIDTTSDKTLSPVAANPDVAPPTVTESNPELGPTDNSSNNTQTTDPLTTSPMSSNTEQSVIETPNADTNITTTTNIVEETTTDNINEKIDNTTGSEVPRQGDEIASCPIKKCKKSCSHGYRINQNGCQTCACKFSESCPAVFPVSRLLCLLQVRSSLSCSSDADCKSNRICCPGTCGSMCRRKANRRRAMLLSILDGAL